MAKRLKFRRESKISKFFRDVAVHTPFLKMISILVVLWLFFSVALLLAEQEAGDSPIASLGDALYWSVAAFSTAGIADTPISGASKIIGGIWIVLGSTLFFGTIVATVTGYFMRPLQRPVNRIIDTIAYNLEHLDDLSIEEMDLLKKTTDDLILHMEKLKKSQSDEDKGKK
jgi:voltage-gated potassium channel